MGKEDYKNEKKGHGFLCVPKELLFDNRYKQLTIEAILLYAYMLDRLKLSIENGWKDSDGKVFIYFSLESIMDLLKCSKGKAISTLKELDEKHGIGLIEKKRSGYGKCSRIYVKEIFELSVSENEKTREKNEEDLEVTNKKHEKSKNKMSRSSKIEPIEVKKINPNNTNKSTLSMRVNKFDKNTGKVTEKNENPVLKIAKRKEQIDPRVQLVADYVVLHPREKYTPQKMAEMVELSKQRFSSLFKANMGKSPMEYVREIRLTTAARALLVSNKNINDIAYECGYEDANYFIREFKSAFGFTPNQYRKIARE